MTEFENHQLIGQGSFFHVHRVKKVGSSERFAIKKSQRQFRGKKDRESYLREVKLMEKIHNLGLHPHIIRYYQAWQEDRHFFVQLELCVCNLTDYVKYTLKRGKVIDDAFIRNIASQINSALQHIHASRMAHLDIKPENVLISADKLLKLCDFGHARNTQDNRDGIEGDSQYMAPELLNPDQLQQHDAADIFSFGLLLFQIATGAELPSYGVLWHQLREGQAAQHLEGSARAGPELRAIIVSMLAPDPRDRPSAAQLADKF